MARGLPAPLGVRTAVFSSGMEAPARHVVLLPRAGPTAGPGAAPGCVAGCVPGGGGGRWAMCLRTSSTAAVRDGPLSAAGSNASGRPRIGSRASAAWTCDPDAQRGRGRPKAGRAGSRGARPASGGAGSPGLPSPVPAPGRGGREGDWAPARTSRANGQDLPLHPDRRLLAIDVHGAPVPAGRGIDLEVDLEPAPWSSGISRKERCRTPTSTRNSRAHGRRTQYGCRSRHWTG